MLGKKLLVGIIAILLLSMVSTALAGDLTVFCVKCKEKSTKADAIDSIPGGKTVVENERTGLLFLKGKTMNKADLIEAIASDASLTKADARRALDAFIGATTKSLKGGNRVALVGFGSFSVSKRKARTGVNSGLELVKDKGIVKFKSGDSPFLPNVEYTTTEDIIQAIAAKEEAPAEEESKEETASEDAPAEEETAVGLTRWNDINDDGRIRIAQQFMDSFVNVILSTLQTGVAVDLGEDFGTFWHANHMQYEIQNAEDVVMKNNKKAIGHIGHVDHGKGRSGGTIQIPAKKVVKFKAGADLAKTVA